MQLEKHASVVEFTLCRTDLGSLNESDGFFKTEDAASGECTETREGPAVDSDNTFSNDIFSCQFVCIVSSVFTNSVGQYFNIIM